ncbi:MAG: efflux RND transporter periplasmic adaptor subunit [Magnetococcales bacterium]|nr:efflux RND transporter periplasmic adaptor subunit [Magnetococcales bacterium]
MLPNKKKYFKNAATSALLFSLLPAIVWATTQETFTEIQHQIRAQLTQPTQAVLAAGMTGKITTVTYLEGERFNKGEKLFEFECNEQLARLKKARAGLSIDSRQYQANLRLLKLQSIGRHEVDIAKARMVKAQAEVEYQRARKNKCVIAAPFSGTVSEMQVHEHEYVSEGDPLTKIIGNGNLEVELIVPSIWLQWIKPGVKLNIHIDEMDQDYTAEVSVLGAEINPVSQSLKIVAKIVGDYPELLPGMSGNVTFPQQ